MTILPIIALSAVVLVLGYFLYGRLVVRWFGIDPARKTPAVELEDGLDFVPAAAPVVLGGHFTAIAAAGPIVGPIAAGLLFGWVPALLWILFGAVFIGAVHDSGALFASIRHRAMSITQVVRENMSRPAYLTFLLFVWICLVYVVIAFADVTALSFAKFQDLKLTVDGQPLPALNGGAVVLGALAYLLFSVIMGLFLRFTRVPWYILLAGCAVGLSLIIWQAPHLALWLADHGLSFLNTQGKDSTLLARRWDQILLLYCFVASIVPMWILLQPRGVIGATFLYAALAFGILGALSSLWTGGSELTIQWPAFTGFAVKDSGTVVFLFPFLFITIACGACSGFHSIVASGTTCKQIRSEKHVRPVAYGAMLLEALVAIFALACVMVLKPGTVAGKPDTIYALGLGKFMNLGAGIPLFFGVSFGLLAFSSFVFDTLDVCTRLGRYVMQELIGVKGLTGGILATVITLAAPSFYLYLNPPGSFMTFWTIFGTSNQLLAALTLVGISVWLWRTGRPVWFTVLPAVFMVLTTATALVLNFIRFLNEYRTLQNTPALLNMIIAVVLFGLAALVVIEALRVWLRPRVVPVAEQLTPVN
jgi:carbon starvation protein